MISCKVVNETNSEIPSEAVNRCIKETSRRFSGKGSCTIVFVPVDKMQALNKEYYEKDRPTDVLTFGTDEAEAYLGEIVICRQFIKEHAKKDLEWEICHAAVHGTLHLMGIHHEDSEEDRIKLHKIEKEIINKVLAR